jgi:hypothetical protein
LSNNRCIAVLQIANHFARSAAICCALLFRSSSQRAQIEWLLSRLVLHRLYQHCRPKVRARQGLRCACNFASVRERAAVRPDVVEACFKRSRQYRAVGGDRLHWRSRRARMYDEYRSVANDVTTNKINNALAAPVRAVVKRQRTGGGRMS